MKRNLMKLLLLLAVGLLLLSPVACGDNEIARPGSDLPQFEKSATELQNTFDTVTAEADARLAALAALDTARLTFKNSILAFDGIIDSVMLALNRATLLRQVSPTREIAAKAMQLEEAYSGWLNATFNDGAVYRVLKAYADANPALWPDEKKLLNDTVKIFKDNGIGDDGTGRPYRRC